MHDTPAQDFKRYNRQMETQFTSTGEKILAHPKAVSDLRRRRRNHPIVMHIMPTEQCNLRCVFCSVAHREACPDLPFEDIEFAVKSMHHRGLKAIILSGGGDPTLYPRIDDLLDLIYDMGLEAGMITNGVALTQKLQPGHIERLKWLRISANTLDYLDDFHLPDLSKTRVTLGFSYIWNPRSDIGWPRVKKKISEVGQTMPVAYVRLLPDCNLPSTQLERAHQSLKQLATELGAPYFHQYKIHGTPPECHLGRVHPVLYTDRMIYPCDSLVLNSPGDDKRFHQEYALCHVRDIEKFFDAEISGSLVDTRRLCPCCVFERQNRLLMNILYAENEPGVTDARNFEHVNFI